MNGVLFFMQVHFLGPVFYRSMVGSKYRKYEATESD